ncbi:MAG: SGNH/GDSL hydrolase family protein [Adhaeribacter sp.]
MRKVLSLRLQGLLTLVFVLCLGTLQAQDFKRWEKEISAFERADQAAKPPKKAIVFTGSSSIRLWDSAPQDFPGKKIINRGFGGSETDAVAYFVDRIVVPYKPKQVVIYVGDNDLAAGKTPEKVLADFKDLFSRIRSQVPKATITFLAIKPSPSRIKLLESIRETNAMIKGFLNSQKRTSYVDVFTPMLLPGGKPRPELFRADSLHMTPAGYAVWKTALAPYLK